jgi:hypothetical protein
MQWIIVHSSEEHFYSQSGYFAMHHIKKMVPINNVPSGWHFGISPMDMMEGTIFYIVSKASRV